ncbi:hypothetical protein SAMN03080594_112100 [Arenibacter palladensis]|uniref:Uncharacterized protein n=1 Tax=Arenibacter palladensis TaxID=237373 RepID=A0A1M5H0V3_9FLAO|nr:hypothetical protein SAMN03080594_112100 [Arenibacter palladensis]
MVLRNKEKITKPLNKQYPLLEQVLARSLNRIPYQER